VQLVIPLHDCKALGDGLLGWFSGILLGVAIWPGIARRIASVLAKIKASRGAKAA
jgi:hypothetical protein